MCSAAAFVDSRLPPVFLGARKHENTALAHATIIRSIRGTRIHTRADQSPGICSHSHFGRPEPCRPIDSSYDRPTDRPSRHVTERDRARLHCASTPKKFVSFVAKAARSASFAVNTAQDPYLSPSQRGDTSVLARQQYAARSTSPAIAIYARARYLRIVLWSSRARRVIEMAADARAATVADVSNTWSRRPLRFDSTRTRVAERGKFQPREFPNRDEISHFPGLRFLGIL